MIEVTCARPECGRVFSRYPCQATGRRYCSPSCRTTHRNITANPCPRGKGSNPAKRRGDWLPCPGCGTELWVRKCEQRRGWRRYCSDECYWSDPNRVTNEGRVWSAEVRRNMAAAHPRSNKPRVRAYGHALWRKRRLQALERDGYTCQRCGATPPARLHVHHLRPCREFDSEEAAHALENLTSVCECCHPAVEVRP